MTLYFAHLCDLLQSLENDARHKSPRKSQEVIRNWLTKHNVHRSNLNINCVVLLSSLFPEKRPDRVYNLQSHGLARRLKRCLHLGLSRQASLDHWQLPHHGDLGACVERVLREAEFPQLHLHQQLTLDQVDTVLDSLASHCRFSAPGLYRHDAGRNSQQPVTAILGKIYSRMQSREAKWFTRMILKDYHIVDMNHVANQIYTSIDKRLPFALKLYDDFQKAIMVLQHQGASTPLRPMINIKVAGRQWAKAQGGIKHLISLASGRQMSVERKHDGEYCQVHIDLSRGNDDCITIFSKSGKDSTRDRSGIHPAIKVGLSLGTGQCQIKRECIIEGEMVVWSALTGDVVEFCKIRKHISRSGCMLGTAADSPPCAHEQLMLMVYDVLLLDDVVSIHDSYRTRRKYLQKVIEPIEGQIDIVDTIAEVNLGENTDQADLISILAESLAHKWEGLVLKPLESPFLSMVYRQGSRAVKFKKDCIAGLGDTADFAVIGAGYDCKQSLKFEQLGVPDIRWTHFFIGCLKNRADVVRYGANPHMIVTDCVASCIKNDDMVLLNQSGKFRNHHVNSDACASKDTDDVATSTPMLTLPYEFTFLPMTPFTPKMTTLFRVPFVFDIAGSGFDKCQNRSIYTLRFPRVVKVKWETSWLDVIDLDELQVLAKEAIQVPEKGDLEHEVKEWTCRLKGPHQQRSMKMPGSGTQGQIDGAMPTAKTTDSPFASTDTDAEVACKKVRTSFNQDQEPDRRDKSSDTLARSSCSPIYANHCRKRRRSHANTSRREIMIYANSPDIQPFLKSPVLTLASRSPLMDLTNTATHSPPEARQSASPHKISKAQVSPLPGQNIARKLLPASPERRNSRFSNAEQDKSRETYGRRRSWGQPVSLTRLASPVVLSPRLLNLSPSTNKHDKINYRSPRKDIQHGTLKKYTVSPKKYHTTNDIFVRNLKVNAHWEAQQRRRTFCKEDLPSSPERQTTEDDDTQRTDGSAFTVLGREDNGHATFGLGLDLGETMVRGASKTGLLDSGSADGMTGIPIEHDGNTNRASKSRDKVFVRRRFRSKCRRNASTKEL